jgi:hypothetical protein
LIFRNSPGIPKAIRVNPSTTVHRLVAIPSKPLANPISEASKLVAGVGDALFTRCSPGAA